MDPDDVEPGHGMYEGLAWVRPLLCVQLRRTLPRRRWTSVRERIRPSAQVQEIEPAAAMASAANHLRELDERSFSPQSAGRVHSARVRNNAGGRMAHVPSANKAASARSSNGSQAPVAIERLVWHINRNSALFLARGCSPPDSRRDTIFELRTALGLTRRA